MPTFALSPAKAAGARLGKSHGDRDGRVVGVLVVAPVASHLRCIRRQGLSTIDS